ncbi:MAG: rhodanese-like domain-containing protein, partial [Chloroflexota bacterium]|nr:rhodanese-like domain-containing protein [Chloroflexota bacterium]
RYWEASVGPLATIHRVTPAQVREQLAREEVQVLDVRRASEHAAGHIEGSRNIPLAQLWRSLASLPEDRPVLVHCQGGLRSAIAASILTAHGRSDVLDLEGGYGAWQDAKTRG